MHFLNLAIIERINAGTATHQDLVDLLAGGFETIGDPVNDAERAIVLTYVRQQFPTQDDVVAHLRTMLAAYVQQCAPGTRQ